MDYTSIKSSTCVKLYPQYKCELILAWNKLIGIKINIYIFICRYLAWIIKATPSQGLMSYHFLQQEKTAIPVGGSSAITKIPNKLILDKSKPKQKAAKPNENRNCIKNAGNRAAQKTTPPITPKSKGNISALMSMKFS